MKMQLAKISRIQLDLTNPRHEPMETEAEVIQWMLSHEKVRQLASHIVRVGGMSPLELMAVVPHPKLGASFITAEGNRRLCALKLLNDPDKASKEPDRRYFHALKRRLEKPISDVNVVIFRTMDDARPWLELRHEGPQDGVGTKSWNAKQKTRFNAQGRGNSPNARALAVVDYAASKRLLPADDLNELALTTLTRFLGTPEVRAALGLTDSREVEITVPDAEFDRAISRFLRDALQPESDVHSRTDADERKRYAETFRKRPEAPITRNLTPHRPGDGAGENGGASGGKQSGKGRNNRSPNDRDSVVPAGFAVKINNAHLKRLYDELRTIPLNDFQFAPVYLLRAVIEQAAFQYLRKKGKTPGSELHLKLGALADQLEQEGITESELRNLRIMASAEKDSNRSAHTFGHYVHGNATPHKSVPITVWDNLEPIMQRVLGAL